MYCNNMLFVRCIRLEKIGTNVNAEPVLRAWLNEPPAATSKRTSDEEQGDSRKKPKLC